MLVTILHECNANLNSIGVKFAILDTILRKIVSNFNADRLTAQHSFFWIHAYAQDYEYNIDIIDA